MALTVDDLGGWPEILTRLLARADLSREEAQAVMASVLGGQATSAQIAAFLIALRAKDATAEEMTGMVRAMVDAAEPLSVAAEAIDTCSTGGSEQRRVAAFHVGTLSAFVVAGAGAKVCKHGNRRASGTSGSADLLEALGVVIDLGPEGVARCVDEAGMGFCLAPRFHPGMRHAGPVRRELGVRTIFNFIAALSNPARLRRQVVGVSDPTVAEKAAAVLLANGTERAMVVFGHDGLDELTTTTTSTALQLVDGEVTSTEVDPSKLGLAPASPNDIRGGDTDANAAIARRLLDGERGPHRDIVLLNAAAGVVVAGLAPDLEAGIEAAQASIDDGAAAGVLERLVEVSKAAAAEENATRE